MPDEVILTNERGERLGLMEKMQAHERGELHLAFSLFVFNSHEQLMLQRRASSKYHAGGLWTNTCCSHPRAGETFEGAAHRRLREEMGFDCPLTEVGKIIYKAPVGDLIEHEYDVLFIGHYDGEPVLNSTEADEWKWIDLDALKEDVLARPHTYTPWLKIILAERGEIFLH